MTNLASLPLELLEAIINEIDDPKYLLQFACAASLFHHLIIPHHIEYRHIRCSSARTPLWSFLFENPALSGRIRWLELIKEGSDNPERPPRLPSCPEVVRCFPVAGSKADIDDPLSTNFLLALMSFTNLRRFVYRETLLHPKQRDAVAMALQGHPSLSEVQLSTLNMMTDGCDVPMALRKVKPVFLFVSFLTPTKINLFGALPLTGLSLHICIMDSVDPMDHIHDFVLSILPVAFPCLKQLQFRVQDIRQPPGRASLDTTRLLKDATWPLLIDLTLQLEPAFSDDLSNFDCLKIFEGFIYRHPNIERLSLGAEITDQLETWTSFESLKKLQSLSLFRSSDFGKLTHKVSSRLHSFQGRIKSSASLTVLSEMLLLHTCSISFSSQEFLCQFLQVISGLPAMRKLNLRSYSHGGLVSL